jgi:hypothetical protein
MGATDCGSYMNLQKTLDEIADILTQDGVKIRVTLPSGSYDVPHPLLGEFERLYYNHVAISKAKKVLKKGDVLIVERCRGKKVRFVFDYWDGSWIVSKTGINDIHASNVLSVNGESVNFKNLDEIPL